ncbi:MAG: hypothetical protein EPN20_14275, partial [Magnetospirillum sp.]
MHYEDSLAPDLEPALTTKPAPTTKPDNVPPKFWDPAKGQVRTDALLRAYLDLERRSSAMVKPSSPDGVPDSPDQYQISHSHPDLASCMAVNQRLHDAGFTRQQAQLVYDLAHDCLLPLVDKSGQDADISHLQQHFGGEARWRQVAPQLAAWGKKNLPAGAYDALAATPDGVKILHRLMGSGEPSLGRVPAPQDEASSEEQLKKML